METSAHRRDIVAISTTPQDDVDEIQRGAAFRIVSVKIVFSRERVFDTTAGLWRAIPLSGVDPESGGWHVAPRVWGRRILKSGKLSDQDRNLWEVEFHPPEWLTALVTDCVAERDRIVADWPEPGPFWIKQYPEASGR